MCHTVCHTVERREHLRKLISLGLRLAANSDSLMERLIMFVFDNGYLEVVYGEQEAVVASDEAS